jgi:peptidoglycan-associated lipoprotein
MRILSLALAVLAVASACGPRRPPTFTPGTQTSTANKTGDGAASTGEAAPPSSTEVNPGAAEKETLEVLGMLAEPIYFAFNEDTIDGPARAKLETKAAILLANADLTIRISGHCDERGSDEFNMVLGNKRAAAAKRILESLGVDAARIEIISYGEERPADPSPGEDGWAKNRRDEFEALSGADRLVRPQ